MPIRHALTLVAVILPWLASAAEAADTPSPSTWQRLSVTWTHALAIGGPGTSLEAAMRQEGFGDSATECPQGSGLLGLGGCSSTIQVRYPFTERLGSPLDTWALRARYQLKAGIGLGLSFCHSPLQTTDGYRAHQEGVQDPRPSIESRATTVAAVLTAGNGDLAWAGVGPSLNLVTLDHSPRTRSKAAAFGVVMEGGLRYPRGSRVFFEAVGQYRYVMPVQMTPPGLDQSHEIAFSHWSLMAGIGLRLGGDPSQP